MRIFIGVRNIAGYGSRLAQGFEQLGVQATFVDLSSNVYGYGSGDAPNLLVRLTQFCAARQHVAKGKNRAQRAFWLAGEALLRVPLLLWALWNFDTFIFFFRTSFLQLYDLPLLKLFKKKVIFVLLGSDARPAYINGALATDTQPATLRRVMRLTRAIKREIALMERYADVMVSHPLYAQFQTRPFVGIVFIALPFMLPQTAPSPAVHEHDRRDRVRILHAPSRPEAKGTPLIRQAVANLQAKGYPIDLIELTGVSNETVLQELARCDFVFDQGYSDVFMPTFATEAAFFGKAVLIAGYELAELCRRLPPDVVPPVVMVHPDAIQAAVERLVADQEYREAQGRQCQAFVERYCTPAVVAERYLRLIQGDIPSQWLCDPTDTPFLYGFGMPAARLSQFLRAYVEHGGRGVLGLTEKPELESAFLALAMADQD